MSALLKENIRILTPGPHPAIRVSKPPNRLKAYTRYSVRDLMDKLADAEVCGDEVKVVHLSKQLRDRRCIPVKILTFADDLRPGYTGE
jgi:chromatin assembly factor 1 subunit A